MYCVKCGVELSKKEASCPLCGTAVFDPDEIKSIVSTCRIEDKKPLPEERATIRYYKNRYIAIVRFCILMSMLILVIINLSVNGGINWSLYPLSVLALLWFCMIFPVKFSHKFHPVILVSFCMGAVMLFLIVIDLLTGFARWSLIATYSGAYACLSVALPFLARKLRAKDIISILAACAAAYNVLLDFELGFTGWSLYALGGIILLWCFVILPMYLRKRFVLGSLAFDTLIIILFLFLILMVNGAGDKFLSLALPLALTVCVPVILTVAVSKAARFSAYGILSLSSLSAAIAALAANIIVNANLGTSPLVDEWSIITASCCFFTAILLFAIERSRKFKEYLNKKLNI